MTEMKTMLSMPRTISMAVSVNRLAQIPASLIQSNVIVRVSGQGRSGPARQLQEHADHRQIETGGGERHGHHRARLQIVDERPDCEDRPGERDGHREGSKAHDPHGMDELDREEGEDRETDDDNDA